MKLRIRGNSIRLRLSKTDVEEFARSGRVSEVVEFGPGNAVFTYSVTTCPSDEKLCAAFDGGELSIQIPKDLAESWALSEQVGIRSDRSPDETGYPHIMVEKDFECLEPRGGTEDDDTFPHPRKGQAC